MKKVLLWFNVFVSLSESFSQGVWTQKADFGGTARRWVVGFSIGNKGYIGTGSDASGYKSDFWGYDPSTDSWTQLSDFGGGRRTQAVGFSIGNKGYIGLGIDTNVNPVMYQDFWQYDPTANLWSPIANFPGSGRMMAIGCGLLNKGYVLTGSSPYVSNLTDFWEYDPVGNTWQTKAPIMGVARDEASYFTCGSKIYLVIGHQLPSGSLQDTWEYDPVLNSWTQKTSFAGAGRFGAACFSIWNFGYIVTGVESTSPFWTSTFWRYNQSLNTWQQFINFPGPAREDAIGFTINNTGYIGTGYNGSTTLKDFWQYSPPVGIEKQVLSINLSIYPNPASEYIMIDINTSPLNSEYEIKIFDVQGKQVFAEMDNEKTKKIDVSKLTKGIYFCAIINAHGQILSGRKLILQ